MCGELSGSAYFHLTKVKRTNLPFVYCGGKHSGPDAMWAAFALMCVGGIVVNYYRMGIFFVLVKRSDTYS